MMKFERFTLVELMIVVAVLSILISILLPSLNKAHMKAKKAVCLSNASQINKGLISLSSKKNGRVDDSTTISTSGSWPWDLSRTFTDPLEEAGMGSDIYYCPVKKDQTDLSIYWRFKGRPYAVTDYIYTHKRYKGGVANDNSILGMSWIVNQSQVSNPENTTFIADAVMSDTSHNFLVVGNRENRPNHFDSGDSNADINTIFTDGHAETKTWGNYIPRYRIGRGGGFFWWP